MTDMEKFASMLGYRMWQFGRALDPVLATFGRMGFRMWLYERMHAPPVPGEVVARMVAPR